jgi:hypothetical protein
VGVQAQLMLPFANDSGSPDGGVCFLVLSARRRAPSHAGAGPEEDGVPLPGRGPRPAVAQLRLDDNSSRGRLCLLLSDSGYGGSTIGNMVQQDMRVLHDLEAETLWFPPAQC